jgi:hypothetical protein
VGFFVWINLHWGNLMKTCRYLLILGVGLAVASILDAGSSGSSLIGSSAHAAEETTRGMLAAQIRMQGFACDKPLSAMRDAKRSKPDHAVWVLKCSNATYRISRIPDMAAKVEQLQ